MRKIIAGVLLALSLLASTETKARGAIYQYSVVEGPRRVYLWVPPTCSEVRGLIVSFKNLLEQRWLEDPIVRTAARRDCLGIVWIGGGNGPGLSADMDGESGTVFLKMQQDLARESGFSEIANAPVLPMGHSAHGQFAWKFAEWAPKRTIAALAIKTGPLPPELDLHGVPLLYVVGETTEWPQFRDSRVGDRDYFWPVVQKSALNLRKGSPGALLSVATDPGGGHFDWNEAQATLVARFIHEACRLRLPKHIVSTRTSGELRAVDFAAGWLAEATGLRRPGFLPAPVPKYEGPRENAYWFFDRGMAEAVSEFNGDRKERRLQMLSFTQDGRTLPVAEQGFAALKLEPKTDGITLSLHPVFLDTVPPRLVHAGAPLGHARVPIKLSVTTGPLEQESADTFRVAWSREAQGGEAWVEEEAQGDDLFRKAVQPGRLMVPHKLIEGAPQTITFSDIRNRIRHTKTIPLHAVSSSGLTVHFYVLAGPAEVVGQHLEIRDFPRAGHGSISVTVVAYQLGSAGHGPDTAVQTADPVSETFVITR